MFRQQGVNKQKVRQAEALTRVACEVNTEGATEGEGESLPDDEVSEPGSDERRAESQVMSEVRRMLYIRMKSGNTHPSHTLLLDIVSHHMGRVRCRISIKKTTLLPSLPSQPYGNPPLSCPRTLLLYPPSLSCFLPVIPH
jgi:hypothetical protein